MTRLAWRTLRFRWGGFVATFLAVLACATMLTAAGGLMETADRSAVPAERLAAAPVVVAGATTYQPAASAASTAFRERVWLDPALTGQLEGLSGVAAAVPDVSFPAAVVRDGQPVSWGRGTFGHAWTSAVLTPFQLDDGRPPAAADEVVLQRSLADQAGVGVGDTTTIVVHGTPRTFTVTGTATPPAVLSTGSVFFAADVVPTLTRDAG